MAGSSPTTETCTASGEVSGSGPRAEAIFAMTPAVVAWISAGVSPATTRPWFCIRMTVGSDFRFFRQPASASSIRFAST